MATNHVAITAGIVQPATLREQLILSVQLTSPNKQLEKLEAMIAAAQAARAAASRGLLFCSRSGVALVDAIHDLTEVDEVYNLADDVRREIGVEREGC